MQSLSAFFRNTPVQILVTLLIALVVQRFARIVITHAVRRAIRGHQYHSVIEERKREDTLIKIFSTTAILVIWIAAVFVILGELQVHVAALLTGAGLVGILVGFGAQNTIRDYLAGIFIIAENQYRVGDIVTLQAGGGVSGVVEDITIRITRLRDLDGNLHTVRNGEATVVTNRSILFANVNVDIGVSYDADVDAVEKIINEVGSAQAADSQWQEDIIEPIRFLRVDSFADSAVVVKALGKVHPARQWDVAGDFRRRIKKAFEQNGIAIPLPQVVVHQPSSKKEKKP